MFISLNEKRVQIKQIRENVMKTCLGKFKLCPHIIIVEGCYERVDLCCK